MDKKQTERYVYLYREIQRLSKELQTKFVKNNRDIHLMKLEEALALMKEKASIKPLDYKSLEGFEFLKKQLSALQESKADGWSKKTYKKAIKKSGAHKNLSSAYSFNPVDVASKEKKK